jgi:transposase InsO family protein
MKDLLLALLQLAVMAAKVCRPGGVRAVIAENLLLKQQLIVLRRARQRAPNLTRWDRLLCGVGSLFLSPGRIRKVAIGLRPATLLAFHQALVRRKYRRLFSSSACPKTPGPKGPSAALIQAIVELKSRNPRFGCPRIARILSHTFRVDLVTRVLAKHYRPTPDGTGPSWLSFIGHTTDSLWSVDLFRCESIVLQSYWVLVVMDQFTRRLIGVGVHRGAVTGADLCRLFNTATHGRDAPRRLSTDHDPLFEAHRWKANLRILEIDEVKTVPHVPWSHPYVERLIGTIRRESLDQVPFWNARDLERKLTDFQTYYNAARRHASLEGHTPSTFATGHARARAELNHVRWVSHCRDLVQLPVAA